MALANPKMWSNLAKAVEHYTSLGYQYVDVPWYVPSIFCSATRPKWVPGTDAVQQWGDHGLTKNLGELVGSAEQSFLYLYEKMPKGQYCAITPCFRHEETPDSLHKPYFMKVELFKNDAVSKHDLNKLIDDCRFFFANLGRCKNVVEKTAEGFDITINGIEVGSYGIRHHHGGVAPWHWIYGTGLAEPRFTTALEQGNPGAV